MTTARALNTPLLLLLLLAGLAGIVTSPASPAWAQASNEPYWAVVEQNQAIVRAGGGDTFYAVDVVERGDLVRVYDVRFDWFKIEPTGETACYIRKNQVTAEPQGKAGVVNEPRCRVTLAMRNGSPGDSYAGRELEKGQKVNILGESGDFYRIQAPPIAFVYLPPGSIRRATREEIAKAALPSMARIDEAAANTSGQVTSAIERTNAPQTPATPSVAPQTETTGSTATAPDQAVPAGPSTSTTTAVERASSPVNTDGQNDRRAPSGQADVAREVPSTTIGQAASRPPVQVQTSPPPSQTTPQMQTTDFRPATPATTTTTTTSGDAGLDVSGATGEAGEAGEQRSAVVTSSEPQETSPPKVVVVRDLMPQAQAQTLRTLESEFKASLSQPVVERAVAQFQQRYTALQSGVAVTTEGESEELTPLDRQIVRARLDQLRRLAVLKSMLEEVSSTRRQVDQKIATQPSVETLPVRYNAVGMLVASAVYNGDDLPRLYRLIDASSRRTLAYIRPSEDVDAAAALGRVVGIAGPASVDPALKARVITPVRIDVLNQPAPSSQVIQPTQP